MARSAVEEAAKLWRMLDLKAKALKKAGLPSGDAETARSNALRTLGKHQDAADALEKWSKRPENQKEH